jgi:hypothetical protein
MTDFTDADLTGSNFTQLSLKGSSFVSVDLSDAEFRGADFSGVVMRGVDFVNVRIDGEIENVLLNGVDVAPFVRAELDRRDPDRIKMRPTNADGFRSAWALLEHLWDETYERVLVLDPHVLHESVNNEWSFIETLRHLVFATDSWVLRAILGNPSPWSPLDLPWNEMPDIPGIPRDRDVQPDLDQMIELRRDRMATVREVMRTLTDETLSTMTTPVEGLGWPPPESFEVRQCLGIVLNEEWLHRQFAQRDLDLLTENRT